MNIQTALAIVQPHRAAELERARAGIEADVEWCRWRRKYGHVGTLAEAKAMLAQDMTEIFGEPISSEQHNTGSSPTATASNTNKKDT